MRGDIILLCTVVTCLILQDSLFPLPCRSLYSEECSRALGAALRRKLEGTLLVLQQRALLLRSQIRIEKLSHEEEQRVQRLILEQLRLGHLSQKKGNLREVCHRPPGNDAPPRRCLHSGIPSLSDSPAIPTAPALRGNSPTPGAVRPKASQQVQQSELPTHTMNVTNHPVSGVAQCGPKEGSRPTSIRNCNSIEDNLDNHSVQTQNGKIPNKGSVGVTKRSTSQDDNSPGVPLSSQESPVFNVCMIKELQTSPMQVSGESLQDRLRDRKETSPQSSLRSSYTEAAPLADLDQPSGSKAVYSNGETAPSPPERREAKEGRPLRYGAMFSTKENAFLHQADVLSRQEQLQQQQQQAGPSYALARHCLPHKSQSFGAESLDSAELDNTSASNSGSEQRLSNLHETSSLEVELPSSHDDNSSSHGSEDSPVAVGQKWQPENPEGKHAPGGRPEKNSNWLKEQEKEGDAPPAAPKDPLRPLVRARTFEVLEGAIDGSPCEPRPEPRTRPGRGLKHELSEHSGSSVTTNSPKRNRAAQGSSARERKASVESMSSSFQDGTEDPERLRELERKKGSLIFEHNFQTYSNIPSTNMMTASMMTASLSSESGSVGVTGSLYSSMVDSALLGSIHSLGALEASSADPVPRPASVALPVMHPTDDPNMEAPRPSRHLPRSERSSDIMEIQQKITERKEATRSPSPDSLSVDVAGQRGAECGSRAGASLLEGSTTSNKEEMDDEEKERDEQEIETKHSDGASASASNDHKAEKRDLPLDESFGSKTFTGSPRQSRDLSENTPIISGGSTLKREKDATGERKSAAKCERQVSVGSVKDVDSIPLVFGFIGPRDEEESAKGQARKDDTGEAGKVKDEEKHQSIFPMFIDFKDIPSPAEEPKPPEKEAASKPKGPSSAVYMYIEADAPSPKTRRKRRSESDGAALTRPSEGQTQEFASLPPVLGAPPDVNRAENATKKVLEKKREECEGVREASKETREGKEGKEKKGFFMFIEAESSSKSGSPKTKRRPAAPPAKKRSEGAMSRSAPSDSILFSSPDSSRLMTKSVIDREEFIAQPPARKNVSLNDKINESSGRDGSFVSGIPRPIHTLKAAKSSSRTKKAKTAGQKVEIASQQHDSSATKPKEEHTISEANDMATSRDISVSELGPTQSSSSGETATPSKAQEAVEAEDAVSDVSSLLSSLDRSNSECCRSVVVL